MGQRKGDLRITVVSLYDFGWVWMRYSESIKKLYVFHLNFKWNAKVYPGCILEIFH